MTRELLNEMKKFLRLMEDEDGQGKLTANELYDLILPYADADMSTQDILMLVDHAYRDHDQEPDQEVIDQLLSNMGRSLTRPRQFSETEVNECGCGGSCGCGGNCGKSCSCKQKKKNSSHMSFGDIADEILGEGLIEAFGFGKSKEQKAEDRRRKIMGRFADVDNWENLDPDEDEETRWEPMGAYDEDLDEDLDSEAEHKAEEQDEENGLRFD